MLNLKSNLEKMIAFVENLPDTKSFNMNSFLDCVIGTYKNYNWQNDQPQILEEVVGISNAPKFTDAGYIISYFNYCEMQDIEFLSDIEKEIISLYTTGPFEDHYDEYEDTCEVSKQSWLLEANKVLEKLN